MLRGGRLVLAGLLLLGACRRDPRVKPGDSVVLRYELSADGKTIESSFVGEPVEIYQGTGDVPAGVDEALVGMAPGEEKQLVLLPKAAFGLHDPARVETMPLAKLGELGVGLKPGAKIQGLRDGKAEEARVLSVGAGSAVLDFNHPLAGKTVLYRFKVLEARSRRN